MDQLLVGLELDKLAAQLLDVAVDRKVGDDAMIAVDPVHQLVADPLDDGETVGEVLGAEAG